MAVVTSWARTYIYTAFENTPPFFFSLSSFYEYMDVSENRGYPQIIHFNRVFHYNPFWGTPIFGNPHIIASFVGDLFFFYWNHHR